MRDAQTIERAEKLHRIFHLTHHLRQIAKQLDPAPHPFEELRAGLKTAPHDQLGVTIPRQHPLYRPEQLGGREPTVTTARHCLQR